METISRSSRGHGARGRWLFSAALSAALLLLTLLLCRATFLNNDDANILYALAGYRTGAPYPTHRFINMLLGLLISGLYTAFPAAPWWTVWQLSMLWLSLTVLCASMAKVAARRALPAWAAPALFTGMYLTAYVYAVYTVSFTLTAGLLGAAGAALLLSLDAADPVKARRRTYIGSIALVCLCFFTRNSSGVCMVCFWGAALLYRLLSARNDARAVKGLLLYALCGGLVFGGAMAVNTLGVKLYNPPAYAAFEAARGHFIDYPHVTYKDDPAFFSSLGWDKTVYDLADNLCYLDEAVTAEAMETAARRPYGAAAGMPRRVLAALQNGETFFRGSGIAQYLLTVPVALLLAAALLYSRKREDGAAFLTALLTAAGAFALCFYLCYAGRFPVRTFQLIALAAASVLAMLCLRLWTRPVGRGAFRRIAAALLGALVLWGGVQTVSAALSYDKTATVETNAAAERYAIAHAENVYLTDVTSLENLSLWTVYPSEKPVNLVDWGGTAMHSGWKTRQLVANGLLPFDGGVFRRENVYFITEEGGEKLAVLAAYLTAHAGSSGYEKVENVTETIAVYRFTFGGEAGQ